MPDNDDLEQDWFPDTDPYDGVPDFIPMWEVAGVVAALAFAQVLLKLGIEVKFERFQQPPSGVVE